MRGRQLGPTRGRHERRQEERKTGRVCGEGANETGDMRNSTALQVGRKCLHPSTLAWRNNQRLYVALATRVSQALSPRMQEVRLAPRKQVRMRSGARRGQTTCATHLGTIYRHLWRKNGLDAAAGRAILDFDGVEEHDEATRRGCEAIGPAPKVGERRAVLRRMCISTLRSRQERSRARRRMAHGSRTQRIPPLKVG